jgi:hypothetical protein
MAFDPQQAAADWAANLAAAGPKIQRGIQSVSVAPGAAAARQKGAYTAGVAASADKWARNVQAVSLGEWQQASITKGVPRVASGAQAAQPKMAAFLQKVAPHIAAGLSALPARGGLEQNLNRANAFARHMANFQNK